VTWNPVNPKKVLSGMETLLGKPEQCPGTPESAPRLPNGIVAVSHEQIQPLGGAPEGACGDEHGKGDEDGAESDQRQKKKQ
jgi:hypothetical protein